MSARRRKHDPAFKALLDMLANYESDKRDADFKQLLDKMLLHTP